MRVVQTVQKRGYLRYRIIHGPSSVDYCVEAILFAGNWSNGRRYVLPRTPEWAGAIVLTVGFLERDNFGARSGRESNVKSQAVEPSFQRDPWLERTDNPRELTS